MKSSYAGRVLISLVSLVAAAEATVLFAAPPPPSTEMLAWYLGKRWTEAALTHARADASQRDVPEKLFTASRTLAEPLGVTLPPLYKRSGDRIKDTATALHYLLTSGKSIEGDLRTRKGPKAAGLFSLAQQAVLSRLLYEPDDDMRATLALNVERAGKRSGAPKSAWQPTVAAMRDNQTSERVNDELSQLMKSVEAGLDTRK